MKPTKEEVRTILSEILERTNTEHSEDVADFCEWYELRCKGEEAELYFDSDGRLRPLSEISGWWPPDTFSGYVGRTIRLYRKAPKPPTQKLTPEQVEAIKEEVKSVAGNTGESFLDRIVEMALHKLS